MTYPDALQWLTTEAPPEVRAAVEKERNDILRAHLRTLGNYGRVVEAARELGDMVRTLRAGIEAAVKS